MDVAAGGYADPRTLLGTTVPKIWSVPPRRSLFGDVVLVTFLVAQVFDGAFTYLGVMTFGTAAEANPVIASLMLHLGHGTALMMAKLVAAVLGIGLHLRGTHGAVALLAAFYVTAAVLPWAVILFF
ncbi:MAG TPA: DUF5658 family protein [Vicinamibacterales bacterium]|nr:DUF5658 family protein [Vicinamibacterales bacterium]